jgi:hypothetical protein
MMSSDSQAMGTRRRSDRADVADGARDEASTRSLAERRGTKTDKRRIPRLPREVHDQPARAHGISDLRRIDRSRARSRISSCGARRFSGVKAGSVARRAGLIAGSAMGDPMRRSRLRNRCRLPADVRGVRAAHGLRRRGRSCRARRSTAGACRRNSDRSLLPVRQHAAHRQEGHGAQRHAADDRDRPGALHGHHRTASASRRSRPRRCRWRSAISCSEAAGGR